MRIHCHAVQEWELWVEAPDDVVNVHDFVREWQAAAPNVSFRSASIQVLGTTP